MVKLRLRFLSLGNKTIILGLFIAGVLVSNLNAQSQCSPLRCSPSRNPSFNVISDTCFNQAVSFSNTTPAPASSSVSYYTWQFGTGDSTRIDTNTNVQYTYGTADTADTFNVKLIAADTSGSTNCRDTFSKQVRISGYPTADFTMQKTPICSGNQQQFTNNSSGSGLSHSWDFGDGSSASKKTPTHTYQYTGSGKGTITNQVELVVTNNSGCEDTFSRNLKVWSQPSVGFNYGLDTVCSGASQSFTNTANGVGLSYSYAFGDGSSSSGSSPTHIYNYTGSGYKNVTTTLTVTNSSGCQNSTSKTFSVGRKPDPAFAPTSNFDNCAGKGDTFRAALYDNSSPSTISSYEIFWDDGTDTLLKSKPSIRTGVSHHYTKKGIYDVTIKLTNNNGCIDSADKDVLNITNPAVGALSPGNTQKCDTVDVTFPINNADSNFKTTNYTVKYGDGTSKSYSHPPPDSVRHVYTDNSCLEPNEDFVFEVKASNACATSKATVNSIKVFQSPEAQFRPITDTVSVNGKLSFINKSKKPYNKSNCDTLATYFWKFGDNSSKSSYGSVSHTYTSTGTYKANLSISQVGCSPSYDTNTVTVVPGPVASFNVTNVCRYNSVAFTNTSTTANDSIKTYRWKFGDGDSANLANPQHTYMTAGTYQVTLIVTTTNQVTDSFKDSVTVYPVPKPGFSVQNVCSYDSSHFQNQSSIASGSIKQYQWDFGDGDSSNQTSPAHQYGNAKSYNVSLIATSNLGCKDTINKTTSINPKPLPAFNYSEDTSQCLDGNQYSLINNSTIAKGSQRYSWYFGDSSTSTSQAPSYSYNSPGTYTIKLIATSDSGCVDTSTRSVTVHPMPTASFTVSDKGQCREGNNYNFTDQSAASSGILSYEWDFGDGDSSSQQSPTHSYTNQGVYTPEVIVTSSESCKDTASKSIEVNPMPSPAFSYRQDSSQCLAGNQYSLTNNSTIAKGSQSYSWDFGDNSTSTSQAPTHSYSSPGTYTIQLVATSDSGCVDTTTQKVTVELMPTASFTVNDKGQCRQGNSYKFTDQSSISSGTLSYDWSFGDGRGAIRASPTHSYNVQGTYNSEVIVSSNKGCEDTANTNIDVHPMPTASFTVNDKRQCREGNSYQFTNQSVISSGSLNYDWNFGDGDTSDQQSPGHSYNTQGSYTSELTVTSGKGCKDTVSKAIEVDPMPLPAFSYTEDSSQCLKGNQYSLTNNSTIAQGSLSYSWYFGDNTTSRNANPTHSYNSSSTHTIELVATSNTGCMDTTTRKVTVEPMPTASFTINDKGQCRKSNSYQFTDQSSVSSGTLSYDWSFGDSSSAAQASPTHSYTTQGIYIPRVIVTSGKGCKDSASTQIEVLPTPNPAFSYREDSSQCLAGNQYGLTNKSTIAQGSQSYSWDLGNDTASVDSTLTHSYTSPGTYTIKLVATSDSGCLDTTSRKVTVEPMPTASFTVNDKKQCREGNSYKFTDQSSISSGTLSYDWSFGDGNSAAQASPRHSYSNQGSFTSEVVVTSSNGCKDTASMVLDVYPMPIASFSINDKKQCREGNSYQFTDQSSISSGILSYNWRFGDGSSTAQVSPKHSYSNQGNYTPEVVVTSLKGCEDTAGKAIEVNPMPLPAFSYDGDSSQCLKGNQYKLNNNSTIARGSQSYRWDLGDNTISTSQAPIHSYNSPGAYTLELVAISNSGCMDTTTRKVTVEPMPTASFTIDDKGQCLQGNSYQFTDQSSISSGTLSYDWSFGDGSSAAQASPIHSYTAQGRYVSEVIVTSGKSCKDTTSKAIEVHPVPQPSFSYKEDSVQCLANNQYNLLNNSTIARGSQSYRWNLGDGTTTSGRTPSHTYSNTGNYTIELRAISDSGCVDTTSRKVAVAPMPESGFTYSKFGSTKVAFAPDDTTVNAYQWKFGDGDTSKDMEPGKTYNSDGVYKVRQIVTNNYGCTDTTTKQVRIAKVGLPDSEEASATPFRAYPNPFSQFVSVEYQLQAAREEVRLLVIDQKGRVISEQRHGRQTAGKHTRQVEALEQASLGTYFIRLMIEGREQVERVIKLE